MLAVSQTQSAGDPSRVSIDWGLRVPMRDGLHLHATAYRPKDGDGPWPAIFTLTPYVADSFHAAGVYYASNGFLFVVVDSRGRGNSEGAFVSYAHDADDGHDITEWLARHPDCNGKVAMGGGSYSGFNQWATAMRAPRHLSTIMPRCASYPGLDFPIRNNIGEQYTLQWLMFTAGRTLQTNMFSDQAYWSLLWRDRFCDGRSFASLADEHPHAGAALTEWIEHPEPDAYWDAFTPRPDHYARLRVPVLTVTGYYDDDQHGALAYYRAAAQHGSDTLRDNNYLVIGPWDHQGVGAPKPELDGVPFGPASIVDLRALGLDWYRWTMCSGSPPALLRDKVMYYVAGADHWRSAPSLEAVTDRLEPLYLGAGEAQSCFSKPGQLCRLASDDHGADSYIYDPSDTSTAELEMEILPYNISDTRLLAANDCKQLVYDSAPFEHDTELSGFFRFDAWLGINQPDTDIRVLIYLVQPDGSHILLTNDTRRARYRNGLRDPVLVHTDDPQLYVFDTFWWMSRMIRRGERLRLVLGPYNSIYTQKNFNSGKPVALETLNDTRPVTVHILVGGELPSVLHLPIAKGHR
jgi:uncharacterized protein